MKNLFMLFFVLCSLSASAQDVIVKKDGSTVVCRVVELTNTEIVYKRWTELNGSNYVLSRNDASAINYQDGRKVDLAEAINQYAPNNQSNGNQNLNDNALLKMYKDSKRGSRYYQKKAKTYKLIGLIGGGALIVSGAVFYPKDHDCSNYQTAQIGGTVMIGAGLVGGVTCLLIANKYKKQYYSLQTSSIYQHEFKLNNGTTFTSSVDILRDNTFNNQTIGVGLHYNF